MVLFRAIFTSWKRNHLETLPLHIVHNDNVRPWIIRNRMKLKTEKKNYAN